jgi:pSer/pThr/pTyr-binding forkhead associated (FHA) protein
MDAAAHYRHLLQLGREEFLAASAAAALVRHRGHARPSSDDSDTLTIDQESADEQTADETMPHTREPAEIEIEVYPLAKKPGASFPDRITIGRTSNNDVVIADHSVSRLHAYVRRDGDRWVVADAGSKNGSWLRGDILEPRKERAILSRAVLRVGDVELTFYIAADLFTALGGS